jgi:DNA-damage-inducible protein D
MKKELIQELLQKFEQASYDYQGVECWSARELQEILGYAQWRNFLSIVSKAKEACENAGGHIVEHFAEISKMVAKESVLADFQ